MADALAPSAQIALGFQRLPPGTRIRASLRYGEAPSWWEPADLVAAAERREARGETVELVVDSMSRPLLYVVEGDGCNASAERRAPGWMRFGLAAVVWLALALVDYFTVRSSAFATIAFVACFTVAARWGR